MDEWGVDVMLLGTQKALALPPGLAVFSASTAAMERAATISNRGYYFDFIEFQKNGENDMTPSTPAISLIYGLRHRMEKIMAEGLENRFARHAAATAAVRRGADARCARSARARVSLRASLHARGACAHRSRASCVPADADQRRMRPAPRRRRR
jgi:aspartate aminotransferase-like enzyme